ncbi:MAG: hypothetical protein WCT18_00910 [Patescibacteria group bacterium]
MKFEQKSKELEPIDSQAMERLSEIDEKIAQQVISKVFPEMNGFMQAQWNQAQESASEDDFFRSRKSWTVDPTITRIKARGLAIGKGQEILKSIDEILGQKK